MLVEKGKLTLRTGGAGIGSLGLGCARGKVNDRLLLDFSSGLGVFGRWRSRGFLPSTRLEFDGRGLLFEGGLRLLADHRRGGDGRRKQGLSTVVEKIGQVLVLGYKDKTAIRKRKQRKTHHKFTISRIPPRLRTFVSILQPKEQQGSEQSTEARVLDLVIGERSVVSSKGFVQMGMNGVELFEVEFRGKAQGNEVAERIAKAIEVINLGESVSSGSDLGRHS